MRKSHRFLQLPLCIFLLLCLSLFLTACAAPEPIETTAPPPPTETTAEPTQPMLENLFSLWLGKDTLAVKYANRYIYNTIDDTQDENIRLSIDSLYADRHYCRFIYSVERLDGSGMAGLTPQQELTVSGQTGTHPLLIETEPLGVDPDNSSRSYFLGTIRSELDLAEFTLTLSGLREDGAEGNTLDCALSVTARIRPSKTRSVNPSYCTVYNVELSPMSLWIDFVEAPSRVDYSGTPRHNIYIKYQDGSILGASARDFAAHAQKGLGWEDAAQFVNYGGNATISIAFTDFIRIDEVQSVIIDTTEIPLAS